MMKLIESYMTRNPTYQAGEKITPDGLVIQTLWRPQPSAKVMIHNWDRETQTDICPHAFIDANSGDVYQTLPFDMKGKHSGTLRNSHMIGIMICEPLGIRHSNGDVVLTGEREKVCESLYKTYEAAVELAANLCLNYGINPLKHIGVYAKRNPEKLWALMNVPPTKETFRADVLVRMGELDSARAVEVSKEKEVTEAEPEAPVEEAPKAIKIRIDVPNLRIRTGPGREYDSIGKFTGVGFFTLTEVQNGSGSTKGWGKLNTGEGWVSLDHVVFL